MSDRNVYGIPVKGDVRPGASYVEQADPKVLILALKRLLHECEVDHVKWVQYTPYFNDGDVCEFSVHSFQMYAKPEYDDDHIIVQKWLPAGEEYSYEQRRYVRQEEGLRPREYDLRWDFGPSENESYPHPEFDVDHEANELGMKIGGMLESGAHDRFLTDTFGDHTEVTFDGNVFTHEEYDHD